MCSYNQYTQAIAMAILSNHVFGFLINKTCTMAWRLTHLVSIKRLNILHKILICKIIRPHLIFYSIYQTDLFSSVMAVWVWTEVRFGDCLDMWQWNSYRNIFAWFLSNFFKSWDAFCPLWEVAKMCEALHLNKFNGNNKHKKISNLSRENV